MIGWIIVIIAVVVGVVSHLANLNKNQPQQQQGRQGGGNPMGRARPTSSEIDRFLEEVNRRKQQQQERRVPPPPVQREPARTRPVLIEQQQKPVAMTKPVKVQQKQVIVAEPAPSEIIIAQPIEPAVQLSAMSLSQQAAINVPPTVLHHIDGPVVKQAKAMLKTHDGMRSVFVLNEILAEPRCRRPYKRRG